MSHVARTLAPAGWSALALALLLPLSLSSFLGLALAVVMLGLLLAVALAGLEKTAIGLLCLGFALAPMDGLRPIGFLAFASASDLALAAGIMVLGPVLLRGSLVGQPLFLLGSIGVVTAGLISSLINPETFLSLNQMGRLVVGALALPFVFALWRPPRGVIVSFAAAFVLGNMANVAASFIRDFANFEGRRLGYSTHYNVLGLTEMLALALCPFLLAELSKRHRWFVFVAAPVCFYGVWISGSRAALAVTALVAVVYPIMARSVRAGFVIMGAAIAGLYVVGRAATSGEVSNNIVGRLFGGGSATYSDMARDQLTEVAVKDFVENPLLGAGFSEVLEAHNIYLQYAAAGGVIGLVFYLMVLAAVALQPFRVGAPLLVLPAMSYILIGPLTTLLWDRYIWCLLALPFLLPLRQETSTESPSPLRQLQERS